jgi:hypothetical protein
MPHPCALNPELEGCADLAAQHAGEVIAVVVEDSAPAISDLKEALVANAPAITEHINAALARVGQWVEWTEDLAAEQVPILVKEIIYWGIAEPGFGVAFGLVFMSALPIAVWYLSRSKTMPEGQKCIGAAFAEKGCGFDLAVAIFGGILLPLIGFITFCCNIMAFLKPIVAPRVFLIEYFRALTG